VFLLASGASVLPVDGTQFHKLTCEKQPKQINDMAVALLSSISVWIFNQDEN